jgi:hypothetical protein
MNATTNDRKCQHGNITFGDVTKCDKCNIEYLEFMASDAQAHVVYVAKRIANVESQLSYCHQYIAAQNKYLSQPLIDLMQAEILTRYDMFMFTLEVEFNYQIRQIKAFTKPKIAAIIRFLTTIRQEKSK